MLSGLGKCYALAAIPKAIAKSCDGNLIDLEHAVNYQLPHLTHEEHENFMMYVGEALVRSKWDVLNDREKVKLIGEAARRADKRIWIKALLRTIDPKVFPIITDVRLLPEIEYFKVTGYLLVRIEVDPKVQAQRLYPTGEIDPVVEYSRYHHTELALDIYPDFDVRISNNEGFCELQDQLWKIAGYLNQQAFLKDKDENSLNSPPELHAVHGSED
jgi:hypothetical protein